MFTKVVSQVSLALKQHDRAFQIAALLAGLGLILAAWFLRETLSPSRLSIIGYPGVFGLSFLGSVAMVFPVPGLISLCVVATVLDPPLVGLVAALGETLGEISGYTIGFGGRGIVQNRRYYKTIQRWMERKGWLVIFMVSLIPNPIFDVVGIAAGATRYPPHKFFPVVLVGKTIKGILVAYSCYYGITALPWVSP
jgi:membrane protein YqaA with SNARE-associated domain